MMTRIYYFSLAVPYTQCQRLYADGPPNVILMADSGERVQVPASHLRSFIGTDGIKGRFRLTVDERNKLKAFEKVS